jgi:hypothetical protein
MYLAGVLGHKIFHLHGYDSSGPEGDLIVKSGGRNFTSNIWLAGQVGAMLELIQRIRNLGGVVSIYGDGLLQTVLNEMNRPSEAPPNLAVFDCSVNVISFDFVTWIAAAELFRRQSGTKEPLRVRLKNYKGELEGDLMGLARRYRMLENVVRPCIKLFGGIEDDTIECDRLFHFSYSVLTDAARAGQQVPRIKTPWVDVNPKLLTITMREAGYVKVRNSNFDAWVDFAERRKAEGYDVVFVRDTEKADEPIKGFATAADASRDLFKRVELYASAHCNLSFSNGPASLLLFSRLPFIYWTPLGTEIKDGYHGPQFREWWTDTAHITPPEQFPWMLENQSWEWAFDTPENIEAGWQRWKMNSMAG